MARIPASIRTNNPGAMYPGPAATQFGSTRFEVLKSEGGVTNQIAIFDDPMMGAAAMFFLLASKQYVGRTIQQAIAKWCGGFHVSTYITVLEAKGGVTRDTMLTRDLVLIPDVAIPLCKAMAWQEAGMDYPLSDEQWMMAHGIAFGRVPMPDAAEPAAKSTVSAETNTGGTVLGEGADLVVPNVVTTVQAPASALRKSGTLWASITGGLAVLLQWAEAAVQFGLDTVAQYTHIVPINSVIAGLGGNVKAWSSGLIFGSLTMVATRRIKATLEGKKG
jgi:hypothetical protein